MNIEPLEVSVESKKNTKKVSVNKCKIAFHIPNALNQVWLGADALFLRSLNTIGFPTIPFPFYSRKVLQSMEQTTVSNEMRQAEAVWFDKLNTTDTLLQSFIHTYIHSYIYINVMWKKRIFIFNHSSNNIRKYIKFDPELAYYQPICKSYKNSKI